MKTSRILILPALLILISGIAFMERPWDIRIPVKSKNLNIRIKETQDTDSLLVWIFFKDKPAGVTAGEMTAVSGQTFRRRLLRKAPLHEETDLPVNVEYLQSLAGQGFRIRHISRWLNAVSGKILKKDLDRISQFDFILNVDIVHSVRNKKRHTGISHGEAQNMNYLKSVSGLSADSVIYDSLFYGLSYRQNLIANVPAVHALGNSGQDVIIAVFDAGFSNLQHESFDSLQILATRDFVNGDESVADDPGQMGAGAHGTNVLSVIAGFKPGKLVGPAWRSRYLLAKTENTESETSAEEDNWIAALEWAESHGADIISSSVAYREMDPGSPRSYDWTWMSGDSTLITKAANIAAGKGVVIVNSAGNEYFSSQHNTLDAPADGVRVIAAGSVDSRNVRSDFSSVGPTTAGRIKPDVMAMGTGVLVASDNSATLYHGNSGTSFSCPVVAGICALMLSRHPELTVDQVMEALHRTSDRAKKPDNQYGYGIVNAFKAVRYYDPAVPPDHFTLLQNSPNPFSFTTTIRFYLTKEDIVSVAVYNILGQEIKHLTKRSFTAGFQESVTWNGRDRNGKKVTSGVYIVRVESSSGSKSKKMIYIRD